MLRRENPNNVGTCRDIGTIIIIIPATRINWYNTKAWQRSARCQQSSRAAAFSCHRAVHVLALVKANRSHIITVGAFLVRKLTTALFSLAASHSLGQSSLLISLLKSLQQGRGHTSPP